MTPELAFPVEEPGLGFSEIPAWPHMLIEPTKDELVRWFQLWSHPQVTLWLGAGRENAVPLWFDSNSRVAESARPRRLAASYSDCAAS